MQRIIKFQKVQDLLEAQIKQAEVRVRQLRDRLMTTKVQLNEAKDALEEQFERDRLTITNLSVGQRVTLHPCELVVTVTQLGINNPCPPSALCIAPPIRTVSLRLEPTGPVIEVGQYSIVSMNRTLLLRLKGNNTLEYLCLGIANSN